MGEKMPASATNAVSKLGHSPIARRERRPVNLLSFASLPDGRAAEVMVLDLSYEGCGIATPIALAPGQPIKLSVVRRGLIAATVLWYSNGKAGLLFDPEPDPRPEQQPRAAERVTLNAEIAMRRLGKLNYRVNTFDLSSDGCKVALIDKPRIGEHLLVKFDGLDVMDSEVVWVEDFVAGLRFERPIHPAVFDLLLARLGG